ncbi:MAG: quinolinate synthase NadA [candidate division Zixibacteria bacterium]|nr:quinolinate synthase NadA [candidate division Zixibacteria bacterium]MDD5426032.1 quinolinate synthase NadA [candidate division Zixibacteria bacterium]
MLAKNMTEPMTIQNAASVEETYTLMKARLARIVPDFELVHKAELAFKINQLKRQKNAVILAHNYMEPALYHTVSDYVGDSLELARISAESQADIIIFCGVRFMAETAKILNPTRTVLLPAEKAGCSLAASLTGHDVRLLKERFPGVPVVSYVNTYADVKAETDICCTSSNAAKVVKHLMDKGHKKVIFLPDEYLAKNVAAEVGVTILFPSRPAPQKSDDPSNFERVILGWNGRCEVHEQFTVEDIENVRKQFSDVVILAHPECSPEVVQASDFSGSTRQMIDYVRNVTAPRYLLLTECSMGDNIIAENPHREMLRLCSVRCPHMNLITLEDTLAALEHNRYEITLPDDIMNRARASLDHMLEIR